MGAFELAIAAGCSPDCIDTLLDMDLGETEGIHIDLAACGAVSKRTSKPLGATAVVSRCLAAGVTHLLLIRHANAAPLPEDNPAITGHPHGWKRMDQMRPLTDK